MAHKSSYPLLLVKAVVVTLFLSFVCHPHERIDAKGEFSRFRDNSLLTGMRAGKRKSHKAESGLCFPVSGMFHKTSNEVKQLGAFTTEHRSWRLEAIDIHVLISHMASSFTHCQIYSFYGSSWEPSSHSSVIYAGIPSWPWKIAQLSFLVSFQWQILL